MSEALDLDTADTAGESEVKGSALSAPFPWRLVWWKVTRRSDHLAGVRSIDSERG